MTGLSVEEAFGLARVHQHDRHGDVTQLPESPLYDVPGAAKYLSTTERHIRDMWNKRQIPAIKVGRKLRFHKDDLDAYIDSHRTGNPSA